MTEKRFFVDKDGRTIVDAIDDSYCECVDGYEAEQFCKKSNELSEENELLKNDNELFYIKISELFEQNEQLNELLRAVREELELADRDNTALEAENELLKKLAWRRVMK